MYIEQKQIFNESEYLCQMSHIEGSISKPLPALIIRFNKDYIIRF
jgi:hypothetical protein